MKRILFVDDECKILDGIRRMLHADRKRWDMQFALSGEDALLALEQGPFDVVVTDMRMPVMNGATLLGHIRDRYPDTARIVLSGYADAALTARAASVAHRFIAKPCDAYQLQSTIERVCVQQDLLCIPAIRRIIGKVGQLPSLSRTYKNLAAAVRDPNASIARIAGIIEQDIAMSAKVLQLTNSAFFGLARTVASVSSAVSYLGMDAIKNLALASAVFTVFVPGIGIPQSVCASIQKHSLRAAAVASLLPVERSSRDTVAVAALLHDIGSLFLASAMPDTYCSIIALGSERGCPLFEVEEELLGTSHAEIGAYLLGLWGIPNLAVEAIAHHHHPTRIPHSEFDTSTAVYIADILVHELEAHPRGLAGLEIEESVRATLETLGVLPRFAEFRALALQTGN